MTIEELKEEFGIDEALVSSIQEIEIIEIQKPNTDIKMIILAVRIYLTSEPEMELDWEHTEYKWITKEEMRNYEFVSQ